MKKHLILTSILTIGAATLFAAGPHTYEIDPTHSGVNFKVRHFFNKVPGKFGKFKGTVTFDPSGDPSVAQANATIDTSSVDTSNSKRDDHLKQDDYFNVEKHDSIDFVSKKWEKVGDKKYKVTGDLTLLGKTKPVTLDVDYLGEMAGKGPYEGIMVAGWEGTTTIDRTDWGLTSGQPIVGDEVEIELSIQGHRPADK
ncbi:YceI family protein [Rubellicoccus peritrichatus]|uniref:YceI family protein n=1 Tax=Rubellicoccus peritrichatus TaxID=3080537 RepID=A0AAQ3QSQ8_9BACT|nr:YceI family protein [Puniceicoccus sp. CR14]WOO42803.1 YceI family protein [Puniceicoccus sp. CR14]